MTGVVLREECMWEKLRNTSAPLVLYGTGNGADKLISALQTIGRTPDGVFASSGFVRQRTFQGMPVLSYEEALRRFGANMTVLIAFGSRLADVMEYMRMLSRTHTTYMPDLPLFGDALFTWEYCLAHRSEWKAAAALFSDDESAALYRDMLYYRLYGELRYLDRMQSDRDSYRELFAGSPVYTALDGGAYRGDSADVMRQAFPEIRRILACEPDPRTFQKLSVYAQNSGGMVEAVNCALDGESGMMSFHTSASRASGASGTNRRGDDASVHARTIDELCEHFSPDLIKLDVEGSEAAALSGAGNTLRRDRPALAVSLYHRTQDVFTLPLWLSAHLYGKYRFHLRRACCYPAWDLMLYAIPE